MFLQLSLRILLLLVAFVAFAYAALLNANTFWNSVVGSVQVQMIIHDRKAADGNAEDGVKFLEPIFDPIFTFPRPLAFTQQKRLSARW